MITLSEHLPDNLPVEKKIELFNRLTQELYDWLGINHPALNVQLLPADKIQGNDYNPNKVAPPEMKLLKSG